MPTRESFRMLVIGVTCLALPALGCAANKASTTGSSATTTVTTSPEHPPIIFGQAAPPLERPAVMTGMPDVATLSDKLNDVVVNITTTTSIAQRGPAVDPFDFFFGPRSPFQGPPGAMPESPRPRSQSRSLGSGFVVDASGYVITNNHVVEQADDIQVRFADDRSFSATVVGRDPKQDVALLKLENAENLQAVVLGDSDRLRVGEYVVAIGNPFGLGHTVTMGIVSAKDRSIGAGPYDDFIQTDASINPGNSGGPLFNLHGEVIGVNTAIHAQGQGIGFAIPVNDLKDVLPQLREKGFVVRGKLGVVFQPITEAMAKALGMAHPRGAIIAEVEPNGPAAQAGLLPGDVIVSVNGTPVEDGARLPRVVARNAPGTQIDVTYLREAAERQTKVTLGALENDTKGIGRAAPPRTPGSRNPLGLGMAPAKTGGVLITSVDPSFADRLTRGDIILEVDRKPVSSPEEVTQAITQAHSRKRPALLRIQRLERQLFVPFEPAS